MQLINSRLQLTYKTLQVIKFCWLLLSTVAISIGCDRCRALLHCTALWPNCLQLWQRPRNDAAPPSSIGTKPECAPYLTATGTATGCFIPRLSAWVAVASVEPTCSAIYIADCKSTGRCVRTQAYTDGCKPLINWNMASAESTSEH